MSKHSRQAHSLTVNLALCADDLWLWANVILGHDGCASEGFAANKTKQSQDKKKTKTNKQENNTNTNTGTRDPAQNKQGEGRQKEKTKASGRW